MLKLAGTRVSMPSDHYSNGVGMAGGAEKNNSKFKISNSNYSNGK